MALVASALGFDGKSYSGEDFRQLIEGLAGVDGITTTPGVRLGFKATAQGSPNATVSVALGWAFVTATAAGTAGMYHVANGAALASPSFAATSGNGRKDRLILRVTSGVPALEIVQGTASGSPAEPSITGDNYLELALVTFPASTTNVTNAMITDRRVFSGKWVQPWGHITTTGPLSTGTATVTAEKDVTGMTVTFTAVANRRYRYTVSGGLSSNSTAGIMVVKITDASNSVKGDVPEYNVPTPTANVVFSFTLTAEETITTASSVTRKLRTLCNGATGSVFADATRLLRFMVEDVGPAGAPD